MCASKLLLKCYFFICHENKSGRAQVDLAHDFTPCLFTILCEILMRVVHQNNTGIIDFRKSKILGTYTNPVDLDLDS